MDNTSRIIDLALAETLITQKETYDKDEYQEYKYELLHCIIGESVIGLTDKQNFNYITRSNRSREKIMEIGQEGLIIELIKNAIKFDSYVMAKTWCRLQVPYKMSYDTKKFNSTNVVPFIVEEMKKGNARKLIDEMKTNVNLCEAAISSFVETRYERALFNKDLDKIYLSNEESKKLIEELDKIKHDKSSRVK